MSDFEYGFELTRVQAERDRAAYELKRAKARQAVVRQALDPEDRDELLAMLGLDRGES